MMFKKKYFAVQTIDSATPVMHIVRSSVNLVYEAKRPEGKYTIIHMIDGTKVVTKETVEYVLKNI